LRIHSIFQSINGEVCAMNQGSFCTFIRFQGCNLKCSWCDTVYSQDPKGGEGVSVNDILTQVKNMRVSTKNITITGGEPLIQSAFLEPLVSRLSLDGGYKISIETNGSLSFKRLTGLCTFVMDIKPPSSGVTPFVEYRNRALEHTSDLSHKDWIKFPIQTGYDWIQTLSEVRILEDMNCKANIAFSAVAPLTSKELLAWIKNEDLGNAVLNVQLHKIIGVS
jgi:7-carboxy-7-deazaguanine synthase